MKLYNKIKNYALNVKSRTFTVIIQAYNGITQWVDRKYKTYAEEGYNKNVYVYSAIRAIAKSCSPVKWVLFEKPTKPKEDKKKIFSHPIIDIMERPNPFESGVTFRSNIITHLLVYGNCYIEEISPRGKEPRELYLLRPDRVSIVPSIDKRNGLVKEYIYRVDTGHEKKIPANKILHLKQLNPIDDLYGLSPIQVGGLAIDQNNLTKQWNIDVLNNGGMPSGSLSTEHNLSEEQYKQLSTQMQTYSKEKRGHMMVLEAGLKFERFSMSSEDMAWVQASKMSAREISIVMGVPPEILGDSTNKTYNNYTQARKAFYEETVIPTLEWLESELGTWLLIKFNLEPNKYMFTFDRDTIEAIQEDRNVIWDKAKDSYFLTFNEKRNLVGYDDVKDGECYLVPDNMSIIKDLDGVNQMQEELDKIREEMNRNNQNNQENNEVEEGDKPNQEGDVDGVQ